MNGGNPKPTLEIAHDGMVRVNGQNVFRRVIRGGEVYLQFYDRDYMRARASGTRYPEVSLEDILMLLVSDLGRRVRRASK